MPPNTSDGPLNTLEQIRDLLAQVLGRQHGEGDSGKSGEEPESQPRKKREPTEAEKLNEQKDRAKGVFDAGVGVLGSIGGAPGQIAAALRQADQVAKSILEFGQALGTWWNPEKKKKSSSPENPTVPTTPQPMKPAPVPAAPEPEKKSGGDAPPVQPAPTLTPPPTVASPVPPAPTLAPPTVPTLLPQQPATLATPTVPAIPTPATPPRQDVPTFTPPPIPALPTKVEPAPVAPVPLPGLATDADAQIPRAEREIQAPVGQTAPVLIPGAPGGESGAAPSNDSARLAAAIEKLVVALDKMDKKDGDTAGKDGDETEQGENFQPRNIWTHADQATPAERANLPVPPHVSQQQESGNDPLKRKGGAMEGMILQMLMRGS